MKLSEQNVRSLEYVIVENQTNPLNKTHSEATDYRNNLSSKLYFTQNLLSFPCVDGKKTVTFQSKKIKYSTTTHLNQRKRSYFTGFCTTGLIICYTVVESALNVATDVNG